MLSIYDFEAHIMLNFSGYQITGMTKKFNSNVATNCEYTFSDFYWFINLCRVYTKRFWQPRTKPDVCEISFPSFEIKISCLQYEASLLSTL